MFLLLFVKSECGDNEFKCTTGGGCINVNQRCDGISQCADLSDEWNCVRIETNRTEEAANATNVVEVNTEKTIFAVDF